MLKSMNEWMEYGILGVSRFAAAMVHLISVNAMIAYAYAYDFSKCPLRYSVGIAIKMTVSEFLPILTDDYTL